VVSDHGLLGFGAYGWHYISLGCADLSRHHHLYLFQLAPATDSLRLLACRKPMRPQTRLVSRISDRFDFPFIRPSRISISRIAHLKEAMGEHAWRVTPRASLALESPLLIEQPPAVTAVCDVVVIPFEAGEVKRKPQPVNKPGFPPSFWLFFWR